MNIYMGGPLCSSHAYRPQFKYVNHTLVHTMEEADVIVIFDNLLGEIPKGKFVIGTTLEPSWSGHSNYDNLRRDSDVILSPFLGQFSRFNNPSWVTDQDYVEPISNTCVAIISDIKHNLPNTNYKYRYEMALSLLDHSQCRVYGKGIWGQPNHLGRIESMDEIINHSLFISIENCDILGYSTEKAINGIMAMRRTLYKGDSELFNLFPETFIPIDDSDTHGQITELLATPIDKEALIKNKDLFVREYTFLAQINKLLIEKGLVDKIDALHDNGM
jgi:hypothetical protein